MPENSPDDAAPLTIAPADPPGRLDSNRSELVKLMARRRSIRRLQGGPFPDAALARILEAARLTPTAYNRSPWHIVVVRDRAETFWPLIEQAFRDRLEGERLARYLERLGGFRRGVAAVIVYEDLSVARALADEWRISRDQAESFVAQALGMVQLALWLAVTAEGLAASLQHWESLVEDRLAIFLGLPAERYRLTAVIPIGYPAEDPRPIERPALGQTVSLERYANGGRPG